MSIPAILGKGWGFPGIGPLPTFWPLWLALELSWHLWVCRLAYWCVTMRVYWGSRSSGSLTSWTYLVLISLCCVLKLCHSLKGCALPSSLLFHREPRKLSKLSPNWGGWLVAKPAWKPSLLTSSSVLFPLCPHLPALLYYYLSFTWFPLINELQASLKAETRGAHRPWGRLSKRPFWWMDDWLCSAFLASMFLWGRYWAAIHSQKNTVHTSYKADGLHRSLQWMICLTLRGALSRGSVCCKNLELPLSKQPHLILQGALAHKITCQNLSRLRAKEMNFGTPTQCLVYSGCLKKISCSDEYITDCMAVWCSGGKVQALGFCNQLDLGLRPGTSYLGDCEWVVSHIPLSTSPLILTTPKHTKNCWWERRYKQLRTAIQ